MNNTKVFLKTSLGFFVFGVFIFFYLLIPQKVYAGCPIGSVSLGPGQYATGLQLTPYQQFTFANPLTGTPASCNVGLGAPEELCDVCYNTNTGEYSKGDGCQPLGNVTYQERSIGPNCGTCSTKEDCNPHNNSCTSYDCIYGGTDYSNYTTHCEVTCPIAACVGAGVACDDGNPCTINDTTICGGTCQGRQSGSGTITRSVCQSGSCQAITENVTIDINDPNYCSGLISQCGAGSPGGSECQTDLSIEVSPNSNTVSQGNSAVYTVTVQYNKTHTKGLTFPTVYVGVLCPGASRCVLGGPGFISDPGYSSRGTLTMSGLIKALRLTVYTDASTPIGVQGLQLQAHAGGLNNSNCYGYNASPAQGSCEPSTVANLNVQAIPAGNFPAICDNLWRAVPGSVNTSFQPVGAYIPTANPVGSSADSVGLAITGTDGKVYSQTCHFNGGNCSWAGFWSPVNMAGWTGAFTTSPPSGILSDTAPYTTVSGNYNWTIVARQSGTGSAFGNSMTNNSGWGGWYGFASQTWGTPSNFIDHSSGSGKKWQFRQTSGQVQYMCGAEVPACDTLTTQNLANLSCTPSQNSATLTWTAAANPTLSRQVIRVSQDEASTIDGSCALIGNPNYDPVNCRDTATYTTNNFTATNLSAGTKYYARVAAECTNAQGKIILSPDIRTTCTTSGASCPALGSSPTVTVNPSSLTVGGATAQAGLSGGANWTNVVFSSSDNSVATVNASGVVTPVGAGSAIISATGTAPNGAPACNINSVTVIVNASASCPGSPGPITFSPASPKVGDTGRAVLPSGFSNCSLSVNNGNLRLDAPANSGNFTAMAVGSATVTGTNCSYTSGGNTTNGCSVAGTVNIASVSGNCPASPGNVSVPSPINVGQNVTASVTAGYSCTYSGSGPVNVTSGGSVTGLAPGGSGTVGATCTYSGFSCPVNPASITVTSLPPSASFTVTPDMYFTVTAGVESFAQSVGSIRNAGGVDLVIKSNEPGSCPQGYCADFGPGTYNRLILQDIGAGSIKVSVPANTPPGNGYTDTLVWGGYDYATGSTKIAQDQVTVVHITVNAPPLPPSYSVSSTLNFSATQNANTNTVLPANPQFITVTNTGGQALTLSVNTTGMAAWGNIGGTNTIILSKAGDPGYYAVLPVNITSTALAPSTYNASVNFSHATAGNKSTGVNYTINPSGGGGTPPQVTLTCNLQANATVDYNGNCKLVWDTNSTAPTSCTASGDWSGSKNVNGATETMSNIIASKTYTITCSKAGFPDAVSTVTATPGPQTPIGRTDNTSTDASVACSAIRITITDRSVNEDGFKIYKGISADSAAASQVGANITSTGGDVAGTGKTYVYTDSGLTGGTNYYYWVVAYKGAYETPRDAGQVNNFPITAIPCTANMSTSDKDIVAVGVTTITNNACNGSTDALPVGMNLGVGSVLTFAINLCNQNGFGDVTQLSIVDKFINLKEPSGGWKFCFNGLAGNCVATGGTLLTQAADCQAVNSISPGQYSACTGSSPGSFAINLKNNTYKIPSGTNTYKLTFQAELVAPASCSSLNICRFQDYGTISYFDGLNNLNKNYTTPLLPFLNGKSTPIIQETR